MACWLRRRSTSRNVRERERRQGRGREREGRDEPILLLVGHVF